MTFDELIDLHPHITLGELIQLFLLGYDDKIYIDLIINGDEYNPVENVRIIDSTLQPYYECDIEYLCDSENSMLTVGIVKDEEKMTNMHENIGKKAKLVAMKEKMDVIYEIIAVCRNLYICRSESGNLTRVREDDVAIINEMEEK